MTVTTQIFSEKNHPALITPTSDASLEAFNSYIDTNIEALRDLVSTHGAVLFRGFSINTAEEFGACAARMGAKPFDYIGGNSPRTNVSNDVYTSTEYPSSEVISLHNEMSYLPEWPKRLFFYSQIPAVQGGQTSLANGRDILNALPDEIVKTFSEKRINYIRTFHNNMKIGKSWQATYLTEDRSEVEEILRTQGAQFDWLAGGNLRVSTLCDALGMHLESGSQVWFNQAEQWHPSALPRELRAFYESRGWLAHDCEHANGEPIDEKMLLEIRRVLNEKKILFNWQKNDFLAIDNVLMLHGRELFTGNRKTLAYLSST